MRLDHKQWADQNAAGIGGGIKKATVGHDACVELSLRDASDLKRVLKRLEALVRA